MLWEKNTGTSREEGFLRPQDYDTRLHREKVSCNMKVGERKIGTTIVQQAKKPNFKNEK